MELVLYNAFERNIMLHTSNTLQTINNTNIFSLIKHNVARIYTYIILTPLIRLYLHGSTFFGVGFWNGKNVYDICSQKTNIKSEFWKDHHDECINLISKDFYSFVIIIETFIYFGFLIKMLKKILRC